MAHLQDPEAGTIYGIDSDFNWTWVKIIRLKNYTPEGCIEPLLYSSNILLDPGFENHVANTGGGPVGDEIPVTLNGGGLQWPSIATGDATIVEEDALTSSWVNEAGSNAYWKVSTASPSTGASHARMTYSGTARRLRMMRFLSCEELSTGRVAISARVDPGDTITMKVKAKSSVASGTVQLRIIFTLGTPGLFATGTFENSASALTTSYVEKTLTAIAPAATVYAFATVRITASFGHVIDLDDGVLQVVAA